MIASSPRVSPWRLVGPLAIAGLIALFAASSPAATGNEHIDEVAEHALRSDANGTHGRQPQVDIGAVPVAERYADRRHVLAEGVEGPGSDYDDANTEHHALSGSATLDRRRHGISEALAKLFSSADPFLARGPPRS